MNIHLALVRFLFYCGLLIFSQVAFAQPDEAYIKKMTGSIDPYWLNSVGNSLEVQSINWEKKVIPGFKKSESTRKQAFLKQSWTFYKNNLENKPDSSLIVNMPHSFGLKHWYNSGWYFIKLNIEKEKDKKYFLILDRVQCFGMIFVNGKRCNHHFGAYTPFETDISNEIIFGNNVIAIFVKDLSAITDGNKLYSQIGVRGQLLKGGISTIPKLEVRSSQYIDDIFIKTSTRKREMEIEFEFPTKAIQKSTLSFEVLSWPTGEKVDIYIPNVEITADTKQKNVCKVKWENPKLWSPENPNLYVLRTTLKTGNNSDVLETRFGFREFWIEGKMFYLNGLPIRLRGDGIYGLHNDSVEFHKKVMLDQKQLFGTNTLRMHHEIPIREVIYAADEAGMLLDNQSSIWSTSAAEYKNGGEWFLKNTEIEFEEWVRRDRNSPSVVIWDLENEMLRVSFTEHLPWVDKLAPFVLRHDNTRPLNNSGAGWFSPFQHMAWLHMQEHYTKIMNDWNEKGTFPLVMGEFWIGGRADFNRMPHSPEIVYGGQLNDERAISMHDKIIEMRYLGVSGIMPFKFYSSFKKPASKFSQQLVNKSIQPITIFSWPRQKYNDAAKNIEREIVVCNDSEVADTFDVSWTFGKKTQTQKVFLSQAEQKKIKFAHNPISSTELLTLAISKNNQVICIDTLWISPLSVSIPKVSKQIIVYKDEKLAAEISQLGLNARSEITIPNPKDNVIWAIPNQYNNSEISRMKDQILDYVAKGGRILCLKQEQSQTWFPIALPFWSAYQSGKHNYALMDWKGLNTDLFYANEAPIYAKTHQVFKGISDLPIHLWDTFDGRVSDHIYSRPSNINKYEQGSWRPLSGGTRMEHISLAEMFYGKGTIMACQFNIFENINNPQAKKLFFNMVEYLTQKEIFDTNKKIALKGDISKSDFIKNIGVEETIFENATPRSGIMIATNGTSLDEIKSWTNAGGKVIVFSKTIAQKFDNVIVDTSKVNLVSKFADHPLFYGITSNNFNKENLQNVKGVFAKIPSNAKEILRGFTAKNTIGAVAISVLYQKGEVILTTIELDTLSKVKMQELVCLLLTNCGIQIPFKLDKIEEAIIRKTVPIKIDGNLNEWVEDMEDRLVTRYIHANPVYLTSKSIVAGPPEFDLNLSVINYYMWNEDALHISGVVFSEERTWESGITWGAKKEYQMKIILNNDTIMINYNDNETEVKLNNKQNNEIEMKTGKVKSSILTDARVLQFNYIFKSGETLTESQLTGETFEMRIPWNLLSFKSSADGVKALLTIEAKGSKLQIPYNATQNTKENWLKMKFEK